MKKVLMGIMVMFSAVLLVGCSGRGPRTLSDKYVKVTDYQGVEIEPVTAEETTDEEVEAAVNYMRSIYVQNNGLDEDTPISDEMVQELSQTSKTVDEYKSELRKQVETSKTNTARKEEESAAWQKVLDNSTVKQYPKDRLKAMKKKIETVYTNYAQQLGMTYEDYIKAAGIKEKDITKAAKAALKQELVADVIANYYGLKPTDEELAEGVQTYQSQYYLSDVDEEEVRTLLTENNVMSWVTDRCRYVESDKSSDKKTEDKTSTDKTSADEASTEKTSDTTDKTTEEK